MYELNLMIWISLWYSWKLSNMSITIIIPAVTHFLIPLKETITMTFCGLNFPFYGRQCLSHILSIRFPNQQHWVYYVKPADNYAFIYCTECGKWLNYFCFSFFAVCAGSLVTRAWRAMMEELEQQAKQMRMNAELLDGLCQDKLSPLYQDKRKARKAYQEEHNKIAAQFNHVSVH